MKALSIRQPWAWLIVNGYKDIENRTWSTSFRGQMLIHASQGMTFVEYLSVKHYLHEIGHSEIQLPPHKTLERGGIVGIADLPFVVPAERRESRWHMPNCFGFKLVNVKSLPFIPCKGRLGFFDVPAEIAAAAIGESGHE